MPDSRIYIPARTTSFIAQLNMLHDRSWTTAASLGAQLVDLSEEEFAESQWPGDSEWLGESQWPGDRYFVATGEVVESLYVNGDAHHSGWWYGPNTSVVRTVQGNRVHRPGINLTSGSIDPTATLDPTARVEAGATIGRRVRVGAYAHIGRDATIHRHTVVGDGTWIGTHTQIGEHSWVSHGATVEPHCKIGPLTSIGAGAHVIQGCEVEAYSRIGAGTTSDTPYHHNNRGVSITTAVDDPMRLARE